MPDFRLPGCIGDRVEGPVRQVNSGEGIHGRKILKLPGHHPAFAQPFSGNLVAFLGINFEGDQKFRAQLILTGSRLHHFVGAAECAGGGHAFSWDGDLSPTTQTLEVFTIITPAMGSPGQIVQTEFELFSLCANDFCLNLFLITTMFTSQSGLPNRIGCHRSTIGTLEF